MLKKTEPHPVSVIPPRNERDLVRDHKDVARHLRARTRLEATKKRRREKITESMDPKIAREEALALALGLGIFEYAAAHRETLTPPGGEKSYKIQSRGSIEWENATALVFDDEAAAVKLLQDLGLKECVSENPTVNKDAVKAKLKALQDPNVPEDEKQKNKDLLEKLAIFRIDEREYWRLHFTDLPHRLRCTTREPEKMEIITPPHRRRAPATP